MSQREVSSRENTTFNRYPWRSRNSQKAVERSPFLMFFRRLDLVSRPKYNYTICCQRDGKRLAIL